MERGTFVPPALSWSRLRGSVLRTSKISLREFIGLSLQSRHMRAPSSSSKRHPAIRSSLLWVKPSLLLSLQDFLFLFQHLCNASEGPIPFIHADTVVDEILVLLPLCWRARVRLQIRNISGFTQIRCCICLQRTHAAFLHRSQLDRTPDQQLDNMHQKLLDSLKDRCVFSVLAVPVIGACRRVCTAACSNMSICIGIVFPSYSQDGNGAIFWSIFLLDV